mgnify:CR=1 FL=1
MQERYKISLDQYFDPNAATVSIRRNGIYFNSPCVQLADLHSYTTVSFERNHKDYDWSSAIYMRGSNNPSSCEYLSFSNDSRRKKIGKGPLYLPCKRLIGLFSSLRALSQKKREQARVAVTFDNKTKELKIPLAPQLEHQKFSPDDLPKSPGVYCYYQASEPVYYGKGKNIFERAQEDLRQKWQFDSIKFSYVPLEEERGYWENFFLESYKAKNGVLPRYNLISSSKKYQEAA